jgi:hypothetical protein
VAFAQNPFNQTGEYGISGVNTPHQFTILFTEQLPFFKDQHGLIGRILGGWAVSGNYVIASGQPYTPSQFLLASFTNGSLAAGGENATAKNYYDSTFFNAFIGLETARPFLGSKSAPVTQVGAFVGDVCSWEFGLNFTPANGNFGGGAGIPMCDPGLGASPTALISLTDFQKAASDPTFDPTTFTPTAVNQNQVRYIANGATAAKVFGTPFGNTARNVETDAITNIANATLFKNFKFNERASFEFRATALNVFNHMNFQSIDPFIEDAGFRAPGTGFGDPSVTGSVPPGFGASATRRLLVGGTLRF